MPIATHGGPLLSAVEIDAYRSAAGSLAYTYGWGSRPRGALSMEGAVTEATVTVRASDMGYRTKEGDASGLRVFPPRLVRAIALDRRVMLDPARTWAGMAWGEARLHANADDEAITATHNSDGRDARLYMARKTWCPTRRIWLDPPEADLALVFKGLCGPWRIEEFDLVVPLRDPSYWIEKPLQQTLYAGTGGLEGPAAMKNLPKPRARGGSAGNPIRNVGLVPVDPANLIYQYTDGPGTVVALYEGGYAGYTFQADTTDLYTGSTTAGQYRTDNSRGLVQLGTQPVRPMTADVTGAFPIAGAKSVLADVIRYTLTEDMSLPAALVDTDAFDDLATALPYVGGFWQGPAQVSASAIVSYLCASMATYIVPSRSGVLRPWAMRALAGTETPAGALDAASAVAVQAQAMGPPLDPPAYRWRVGYQRNHIQQDTDIGPLVAEDRKGVLAQEMLMGGASSAAVLSTYRRPSDPPPLGGALLVAANADTVAGDMLALLSSGARLYDVTVPLAVALAFDIGDVVRVTYPAARLRDGRLMQIVGERIRPGQGTAVLEVFG